MIKKKFAVIGHPIGHTMSPFIHKRLFELAGQSCDYDVIDIAPEDLGEKFQSVLKELSGFNITIPHKQAIIPYLTRLDPKAALYGSVNTVKNIDNQIYEGYTTDPDGFLKALKFGNIPFKGNVVIVGCGGVARTFAYEAALAGCNLTIAVRPEDLPIAASLAGELRLKLGVTSLATSYIDRIEGDFDLLVNATPVGMYPHTDAMAVSKETLSHCANVFDAVYNPLETTLLKTARSNGSTVLGGISMLVWQAVVSHEIWDGSVYNDDDISQLCLDTSEELNKKF
ncbi:MAG: shikimate dehydrogenase family protein [Acutalibacteraceae bacterium]